MRLEIIMNTIVIVCFVGANLLLFLLICFDASNFIVKLVFVSFEIIAEKVWLLENKLVVVLLCVADICFP